MDAVRVIMTTYNRRKVTLACLAALDACDLPTGYLLDITLVDASSPDGTAAAVRSQFPEVNIIAAPATTFWAQGMRRGWEASQQSTHQFVLWLNDDVVLDVDALSRLLDESAKASHNAVVALAVRDPQDGSVSYAGFVYGSGTNRLNMPRVLPAAEARPIDAFSGNVVLIPSVVDRALGGFPEGYVHGLADYAYGLAAREAGVPVLLAPGAYGACARNSPSGTWQDKSLPAHVRYQRLRSPKGLSFRPWVQFCWRFGGIVGIASALKPFIILGSLSLLGRLRLRP